ncbi:MAG: TIGR03790 family protein [Verrucomicrobia bacterium]|nr:TIGR03790 family protein [Verrucomicrobiota bacterium]
MRRVVPVAAGLLAAASAVAGGGPQNVLLIVNGQSQASLEIASHYQQLRNLPEDNILHLAGSNTAAFYTGGDLRRTLTVASFRTNVLWPALNYLRARGLSNQVDYLVYSTDIPTRIDCAAESNVTSVAGASVFSLTAMSAFADLVEGVNTSSNAAGTAVQAFRGFTYNSNSPATFTTNVTHATVWAASPTRQYYNSTLLGWTHWFGNTTDELKAYLTRARAADGTRPTGTIYMDDNADVRGQTRRSQFAGTSNELAALGIASFIITNNPAPYSIVNRPDILGAVMGAAAPLVPAGSTYLPGSIAESLTSFSGILDNSGIGQFRMSQHLGVGVAGTSGTITEPFAISGKFPAARMHAHYARGATLGEAFTLSVQTPYHLLVMGDALCRPHARIPSVTLGGVVEGGVVSNTITLTPGATTTATNGIAGYDLFVDGLLRQSIALGGNASLNTTTLADGWHEVRVVAYENSAVRTQGDRTVNFRVNNAGQQIQVSSTNLTATVGGSNVSFTVTAVGGTPATIEIRRGQQLLATVTGATGTATIALTNLGPGRSVLRAVAAMGSGLVRSAPIVVNVNRAADTTPPQLGRYYAQMGTNASLGGLRAKAAYKNSDYVYFNLVPSEPVGLTGAVVRVGGGTVAPFPIRWVGMSTTNIVPNTAGLTNPMSFRYTLNSTRDAEGPLPVQISLTDGAGLTTVTNTFIVTDYTLPIVTQAVVLPAYAAPGMTAKISISAGEILSPPPEVYVGGAAATFVSSNGNFYNYQFTVPGGTPPGLLGISVSNVLDLAENFYESLNDADDFESQAVGSYLTNDTRWTVSTATTNSAAIYVTNNLAAPGSTRSVVFKDAPGSTNQSGWFNFNTPRVVAVAEFDLYLDNRNPASNAAFTVRATVGTAGLREVDLVFAQTSLTNFRVGVASLPGTTYYTNGLPVQTWHHVRFVNDVLNNKFTVAVNGVTVASNVTYFSPFTSLTNIGSLQFISTSADEDVYLDNFAVTDVTTFLNVSDDSDGDGLPDAWELRYFPTLTSTGGATDGDGDGQTDLYEFLAGTSPVVTNAAAPPVFNSLASLTLNEDAGPQAVSLTGISGVGPVLGFTATSSDTNLVPNPAVGYASPEATGTLTFTPATNANGTVTLTVVLAESGSTARLTNQFTVTILPVTDAPTLASPTNLMVLEDAPVQVVSLKGISSGPTNESGQSLIVTATSSDTSVIPNPVVTYISPNTTGSLAFAPATNANGTATITMIVSDDGGTANGGVNALTNTFLVTIIPVNDAPTLTPLANLTILENSGVHSVAIALSDITRGATNEMQVVAPDVESSDSNLFPMVTMRISTPPDGSYLYVEFAPATNATGTATISIVVRDDGGTANGGVDAVTNQFVVTVLPSTPPPLAISRVGAGFSLQWPSNTAGLSLQFTEDFAAWFLETNPPPATNGILIFTNAPAPGQRFYRLFRP